MPNDNFVSVDIFSKRIDASMLATSSLLVDYGRQYEALCNGTAKPVRQRRESKPRVPAQFKKAIEAGLPARLERRPDGTVIVEIGQAIVTGKPEPKDDLDREFEEFEARHG